jgi:hypothetical protein
VDGIPLPNAISNCNSNHANIALPKKWDYHELLNCVQTCTKYTIIINYPIPTVITEIYSPFGTVSGHSEHFPKKKLYMDWHTHEEWGTQWIEEFIENSFQKQRKELHPIKKKIVFMVISNYIFINIVLSNLESIILIIKTNWINFHVMKRVTAKN